MSFKDKRLRYGSFSTVMIVAAVALFVLVNLVAGQLNVSRDITREQLFTLSDASVAVARDLALDVDIFPLWQTGQENFMFRQILEEYAAHSDRITMVIRDPVLHPHFVEQFASGGPIAEGSIIVTGPDRYRVIHSDDLFTTDFDFMTFQPRVRSIDIEPQVTNAIKFVSATDNPVVYRVIGNNEFYLPPNLIRDIEMAGYEIREINPIIKDIPEDADMLFISFPDRDWSPVQAERILTYLENGGRAIFVLGYRGASFPQMNAVLAAFGVAIGNYIVIEGNPNYFTRNTPNMLLPDFLSSEITDPFLERGFVPLLVQSTGIDTLDLRRPSTVITPLIRTSNQAFGRIDPDNLSVSQLPEDIPGPFDLAVKVEDNLFVGATGETLSARMVVIGSEFIMAENLNFDIGGTNWSFIVNSLNWLRDEPAAILIPSRTLPQITPLAMNQAQTNFIVLFSLVILPLVFGITGLVVWLRRRNA